MTWILHKQGFDTGLDATLLGKWDSSYLNAIWFNKSYPSHVRVHSKNKDPQNTFYKYCKCMLFELEAKLGVKTCD